MHVNKRKRTLAIDPGVREMGVAVFEDDRLVYHGVETFGKFPTPQERLRQSLAAAARLIRDFRPGVLVIEKNFIGKNRCAALLKALNKEVAALCRRRRITVVSLAPNTVKKTVTGYGWATKATVAKAIVVRYPKLKVYLPPRRKWKLQRHYNMFDAVAIGLAFQSAAIRHEYQNSPQKIRAP